MMLLRSSIDDVMLCEVQQHNRVSSCNGISSLLALVEVDIWGVVHTSYGRSWK